MNRQEYIEELKGEVLEILPPNGREVDSDLRLSLTRIDSPDDHHQCLYVPMFATVLQGRKRSVIGGQTADYGVGESALVSIDLPGVYHMGDFSPDRPFVSVAVRLDRQLTSSLISGCPELWKDRTDELRDVALSEPTVTVSETTEELLDALLRLVRLFRNQKGRSTLAPMLLREIHYLLLCGSAEQVRSLYGFCTEHTPNSRIAQAIEWLRAHFKESLEVADLAGRFSMAPSTFHKYFKQVTTLSPIQFQKHLRLHEAERLMLTEGLKVEDAALTVGYESSSQFSREYKRLFGESPRQDILRKTARAAG